jgi:hypothetical protein
MAINKDILRTKYGSVEPYLDIQGLDLYLWEC